MASTFANGFDSERDAGLIVPESVAQQGQRFATDAEIGTAVDQLNAGQPVTALPKQSWSIQEAQSFNAKLDAFDQQAKAAKAAAQQAAIDAKMLDQMSRVAKSTKDIEIARRNIDVMGLQSEIQSGVPIHQAVARHPLALGSGFANTLRATTPVAAPSKLEMDGMPPAVMANGRPYWPPASSMPAEPLSTTAVPITDPSGNVLGHRATTGPRTGTIIQRTPGEGSLTATERSENQLLMQKRNSLERQLIDLLPGSQNPKSSEFTKFQNITNQLGQIDALLQKRLPGAFATGTNAPASSKGVTGTIHPLPTDKSKRVKGQLYDTPKGAAEWTGEGWIIREKK